MYCTGPGEKEPRTAKVSFASSLQAGGLWFYTALEQLYQIIVGAEQEPTISQTCTASLGGKLHIRYMLLLASIFTYIYIPAEEHSHPNSKKYSLIASVALVLTNLYTLNLDKKDKKS